ncbi:4Fe-4S dicluster domain-containing protein [bacterium]|nr:MAG: 4Fe-4S dicluster domain-containing protein [bacterium]
MFDSLKVRLNQGWQYIPDPRRAVPAGFKGRPVISAAPCGTGCTKCADACPTKAIGLEPVRIDLGRCIFCTECVAVCPEKKFEFTPETRMGAASRSGLTVSAGGPPPSPVDASAALKSLFGRSLKLRQVSAGGCNGCELELNALANVNFDLQRYGIEWVASPRHADGLVLTGPLTQNMADAVQLSWDAMPEPRFVVAFGACAISGGPFMESPVLDRGFLDRVGPVLYVPGCPPHPLTFVSAILDLLGVG